MRILPLLVILAALVVSPLQSHAEILVKNGESIAFMGDSITQSGPGSYVRLVEGGLADQGVNITVVPAGVSGNKSNDMLARLDRDVLSKKPTWMTLSVGVNDVMHGARGVELEDYKKNVTGILDRAQQAGVKVLILTATQIWLPVTNPENVKLAGYNAFLRETAKARNLPLADLNAAMVAEQTVYQRAGAERSLTFDGVHMNIYGNMVMAKGVLAAFGLNEAQLAAVQTKWNKMPDVYPLSAPPTRGTGTGLTGQYFSDGNFTSLMRTQVDPQIRFNLGAASPKNLDGKPMLGVGPDNFSVRWTGQIQALEEGNYNISVNADDSAKVWIGDLSGAPLINKTAAGGPGSNNRTDFKMAVGQKYDIKIEYTDISDKAEIALQWIRPGLNRDFVPQSQLYPTTAPVTATATAVNAPVKVAPVRAAPAPVNSAAVPTNRGTEEYHQALNAQAKKGDIDLLFVGDSITMAWRSDGRGVWDERYAPLKAANFGLGGDKTEHVLWRLQNGNLEGIKPKVVVLLIGTNNVGRISSKDLAEGIAANVKEIQTRLPKSKVLLMGLFPRGETPDHPHRIQVAEVNAIISKLDDGKRVFFTDIGSQMILPDGSISRELLPDLLHLSTKGYKLWADNIQEKIDKFMK